MKTYIKKSRDFLLIAGLAAFLCIPLSVTYADLDENFRENLGVIIQQQCFNSIEYSADDIVGFEKNSDNQWECAGGKCAEYQETMNCLVNDAFAEATNRTNSDIENLLNQTFNELRNTELYDIAECKQNNLFGIQEQQESLGFVSDCTLSSKQSACRVTETLLNELCGYQNFLTAKVNDRKSFSAKNQGGIATLLSRGAEFKSFQQKYIKESSTAEQSFMTTVKLYNNFIQNYRFHAWIKVIQAKLETIMQQWQKIHQAIETFPNKFIDASSLSS